MNKRLRLLLAPGIGAVLGACASVREPAGPVVVSSPGEPWLMGQRRQITWRAAGISGAVRLEIARGSGSAWETLDPRTANDGRSLWRVTGPPAANCRLRVVSIRRPKTWRPCAERPTIVLGPNTETVALAEIPGSGIQRWADIAGHTYSAAYHANFSYRDAVVRVNYRKRAPTFVGTLTASGLKPNFAYQIKLVGNRDHTWAFETIGYMGRWLIGEGRRTNFTDAQYRKRKNDPDVLIESYILLDYFVTDREGKATESLVLDSSFHVIWSRKLNRWRGGPGRRDSRLFTHTIRPGGKAYWWKTPTHPVTVGLWLEHEWVNKRPPKGTVQLPTGAYRARLQITEEGFHLTQKRRWARVMQAPVSFQIVPE